LFESNSTPQRLPLGGCSAARGDDPEVVIQRIADYRADGKDDPNYYARHTVMKAQAELQRQGNGEQAAENQRKPAKQIALDH
jgi:hypothetical protein